MLIKTRFNFGHNDVNFLLDVLELALLLTFFLIFLRINFKNRQLNYVFQLKTTSYKTKKISTFICDIVFNFKHFNLKQKSQKKSKTKKFQITFSS